MTRRPGRTSGRFIKIPGPGRSESLYTTNPPHQWRIRDFMLVRVESASVDESTREERRTVITIQSRGAGGQGRSTRCGSARGAEQKSGAGDAGGAARIVRSAGALALPTRGT